MTPHLQKMMAEATALTRSGDLRAATLAIQRALGAGLDGESGGQAGPASFGGSSPFTTARPSGRGSGSGGADVIEGVTRWVDDAADGRADTGGAAQESWARGRFVHERREIGYRLFIPAQAAGATAPRPMIVMLHGCTQDADDFAAGTGMNALARTHGFIVLYPEQAQRGNAQKCWNWFKTQHQVRDRGEPAAIAALCRSLATDHAVDASRIYVAGLSAGGAMAHILGRAYPDLFAAVGVHSGLAAGAARDLPGALAAMRSGADGDSASAQISPPTIVFHGDADTTVNPANGAAIVRADLKANGAIGGAPSVTRGASAHGQRFTRTCYGDGAGGVSNVEHWQLHGAGHAWSGGSTQGSYTDARGVNASAEMVRFFLSHRLAARFAAGEH